MPAGVVVTVDAGDAPIRRLQGDSFDVVHGRGAVVDGRQGHSQCEAGVVGDSIEVPEAGLKPAVAERRFSLDESFPRKGPVTADAQGAGQQVVSSEAEAEQGRTIWAVRVDGQRERDRLYKVWRQAQKPAALPQPFPH